MIFSTPSPPPTTTASKPSSSPSNTATVGFGSAQPTTFASLCEGFNFDKSEDVRTYFEVGREEKREVVVGGRSIEGVVVVVQLWLERLDQC